MSELTEVITKDLIPSDITNEEQRRHFASAISGYFEELAVAVGNLKEFSKTLTLEAQQKELETHIAKLEGLIQVISDSDMPINQSLSKRPWKSQIERLGLSSAVIQARENGLTIAKISDMYELKPNQVSKFFKYYDKASPVQQKNLKDTSIFNTTQRLEDLNQSITYQLKRLQDKDPKNHVLYAKQLLECIRLASELTEKVAIHQQLQALIKEVSAVLLEEISDPQAQVRVVKRLESIKKFQFVVDNK